MQNLKNTLLANAAFSGISGLMLVGFHQKTAMIFGVGNSSVFWFIGAALVFFAATVFYESRRCRPPFVWWIIIQDFLWVAGSVVLLIFRPLGISVAGNLLMAAVAIVVAIFGWRQWQFQAKSL